MDRLQEEARAYRRFIVTETLVNGALSAVLSAGFVWLIFGGRSAIPLRGADGVIFDQLPMTFMISLMMTFGLTLFTRARCAKGQAPRRDSRLPLPRWLPLRAVSVAVVATVLLVGISAALLAAFGPPVWSYAEVTVFKMIYGTIVAMAVTPVIVVGAMRDGHRAWGLRPISKS